MDLKRRNKQAGFALSSELLLTIALLGIGMIVGLATIRNSTLAELEDFAEAFGSTNQSYNCSGIDSTEPDATTAGCLYTDDVDNGDGSALTGSSGPGGDLTYFSSLPAAAELLPPPPPPPPPPVAPFTNGGFEAGFTGWTVTGSHPNIQPGGAGTGPTPWGWFTAGALEGTQYAEIGSNGNESDGILRSQLLSADFQFISFWHSSNTVGDHRARIIAADGVTVLAEINVAGFNDSVWREHTIDLVNDAGLTAGQTFFFEYEDGSSWSVIDDVHFSGPAL